jgi:hypothetical protein
METMNTDTPETDGEWNRLACQDHPEFERNLADFTRKLERERDQWRNEHDRVVREFQHRLMVIGISVIKATSYPESAISDGSPDTNTQPTK